MVEVPTWNYSRGSAVYVARNTTHSYANIADLPVLPVEQSVPSWLEQTVFGESLGINAEITTPLLDKIVSRFAEDRGNSWVGYLVLERTANVTDLPAGANPDWLPAEYAEGVAQNAQLMNGRDFIPTLILLNQDQEVRDRYVIAAWKKHEGSYMGNVPFSGNSPNTVTEFPLNGYKSHIAFDVQVGQDTYVVGFGIREKAYRSEPVDAQTFDKPIDAIMIYDFGAK